MTKSSFSINIDATQENDGIILDFDYVDSENNNINFSVKADNYQEGFLEMYKEVIETLTALEEQKEEEPKEELTEEQKYIKKLEAEVKALRSEREKINKRKYNNNVKYYKIPSIPKSFPFWF